MRLKAAQPARTRQQSTPRWVIAGVLLLGLAAAGCASSSDPDGPTLARLPASMGGLPEDTPARPTNPGAFPAVHDMPPPRAAAVLTPEQVKAAEADMDNARVRAKKQTGTPVNDK
jgi:hypothetical protein